MWKADFPQFRPRSEGGGPKRSDRMVEVFKTNVKNPKNAGHLLGVLQNRFPQGRWNFDLEDCDKILRVEADRGQIDVERIIETVREHDFRIEVLPEGPPGKKPAPQKN